MEPIKRLVKTIEKKGLKPNINLDRPTYIQPEDRIQFRATRIAIILGILNTKFGLSKNVIACVDFLLRNEEFQSKFIAEYFKGQRNILDKISEFKKGGQTEIDFNIVQYKSPKITVLNHDNGYKKGGAIRQGIMSANKILKEDGDNFLGENKFSQTVLKGLTLEQKHLPSWLIFDSRGSKIFKEITDLPEYFPAVSEFEIFHTHIILSHYS